MNIDLNSMIYDSALPAINEIIEKAVTGDITTIALLGIGIIVGFVLLILLVELTAWLVSLIKRFFLFVIVAVSTLLFFVSFWDKIFVPEPDLSLVGMGVVGVLFALVALVISVLSIKRQWQKPKEKKVSDLKTEMKRLVVERFENELEGKATKQARPAIAPTQAHSPSMLSKQAFSTSNILASFHDRSLLAVLSYMVVAEFGVISGITVSAPNEVVGLIFFAMFLVGALVFIKSTYHNYLTGLKHLFIALIFGAALAVVLSHIWLGHPLEELLSLGFFKTNALVALVTGLAVSLFMGSKA